MIYLEVPTLAVLLWIGWRLAVAEKDIKNIKIYLQAVSDNVVQGVINANLPKAEEAEKGREFPL